MNADVRRRRLIEVLGKVARGRPARTIFIAEDMHWIDSASEKVIAEFAETLSPTTSMLVVSFRPEYRGPLREMSEATIKLTPLDDSTTEALAAEIIGPHLALRDVAERIAQPSAGNPFFLEEIIRDLVGRGRLLGNRGDYRLTGGLDSIAVPATVQSVLAARIDRLAIPEKSLLNAAAVIGSTFDLEVLRALVPGAQPDRLRDLVSAELIDQIQFLPEPRYAFRHPLVRTVAYESQLTATRVDGHRRLAAAIQARNPAAAEENSALIAHHLEAAGELEAAYTWYMRSGDWLRQRDVIGARDGWVRGAAIADRLPPDHDDVTGKRIAPRALLTFTGWQTGSASGIDRWFDELRELATQSGDLLSLAMGMSGRLDSLITAHRFQQASVMASELLELVDTVNGTASEKAEMLLSVADAQFVACEFTQALRTLDRVRKMASGLTSNELSPACCIAGVIKIITGRRADGRRDLHEGHRLARGDHPVTYAVAVAWKTDLVVLGFEPADEALVNETRDALLLAESIGDAYALSLARWAHGTALLRSDDANREVGLDLLRQSCVGGLNSVSTWCDAEISEEMARQGQVDAAIDTLRTAVQSEIDGGDAFFVGYPTAVLVRLLIERGASDDWDQARDVVAQLEAQPLSDPVPAMQLWPLRCRAILAGAVGDTDGYAEIVTRYRELAEELDARGHLAVAKQFAAEPALGG
jgi:adenylate cyclase